MDINFFDGCENILYIYTDEENNIGSTIDERYL